VISRDAVAGIRSMGQLDLSGIGTVIFTRLKPLVGV
jgi:hypothetical protein